MPKTREQITTIDTTEVGEQRAQGHSGPAQRRSETDMNQMERTKTVQWNGRTLTVRAGGEPQADIVLVYRSPLVMVNLDSTWTRADAYHRFLDETDLGEISDAEGNNIGIPCPNCDSPILYEHLQASADVWGIGCDAFVVCPHANWVGMERSPGPTCNTLVFLEDVPAAYEVPLLTARVEALRRRMQQDSSRLSVLQDVLTRVKAES